MVRRSLKTLVFAVISFISYAQAPSAALAGDEEAAIDEESAERPPEPERDPVKIPPVPDKDPVVVPPAPDKDPVVVPPSSNDEKTPRPPVAEGASWDRDNGICTVDSDSCSAEVRKKFNCVEVYVKNEKNEFWAAVAIAKGLRPYNVYTCDGEKALRDTKKCLEDVNAFRPDLKDRCEQEYTRDVPKK